MNGREDLSLIAVEISKKITELLDSMEYSNNEMLLTKGHIKSNLNKLISSSNRYLGNRNRHQNYNFSVDPRGKLKAEFLFR